MNPSTGPRSGHGGDDTPGPGERRRRLLLEELARHRPRDATEQRALSRIRSLARWLADPLSRLADPTHVTGSAVVVSERGRVLLHRHRRLGLWLQPGGHLEPGESPARAAVRETLEETGVPGAHPPTGPELVHVDVHEGPGGHVHLDLRYLLRAAEHHGFAPGAGESQTIAWWEPVSAVRVGDHSLAAAVRAALASSKDRATGTITGA